MPSPADEPTPIQLHAAAVLALMQRRYPGRMVDTERASEALGDLCISVDGEWYSARPSASPLITSNLLCLDVERDLRCEAATKRLKAVDDFHRRLQEALPAVPILAVNDKNGYVYVDYMADGGKKYGFRVGHDLLDVHVEASIMLLERVTGEKRVV